jgi:hypothetical protein
VRAQEDSEEDMVEVWTVALAVTIKPKNLKPGTTHGAFCKQVKTVLKARAHASVSSAAVRPGAACGVSRLTRSTRARRQKTVPMMPTREQLAEYDMEDDEALVVVTDQEPEEEFTEDDVRVRCFRAAVAVRSSTRKAERRAEAARAMRRRCLRR